MSLAKSREEPEFASVKKMKAFSQVITHIHFMYHWVMRQANTDEQIIIFIMCSQQCVEIRGKSPILVDSKNKIKRYKQF